MSGHSSRPTSREVCSEETTSATVFQFSLRQDANDAGHTKLSRPVRLGDFCLDSSRRFRPDRSQLKFVFWPEGRPLRPDESIGVNWNLNDGIEKVQRKDDWKLDERLDNVLLWIRDNRGNLHSSVKDSSRIVNADFVCYRGLITKLMSSPYERREPWIIGATLWKGTVYLCKFDTADQIEDARNRPHRQKVMCSWGYKFEQFLSSDKPGVRPDTAAGVVESEEFCCVFGTRLGSCRLIYAAEMDALDMEESPAKFVEFKTTQHCRFDHQRRNLNRKMLKWWAQSYLVDVESILVGFRNDVGVVTRLQKMLTHCLPKQQDLWSARVCLDSTHRFLEHLRNNPLLTDDPRAVLKLQFSPQDGSVCSSLVTDRKQLEKYRILPDWYIRSLS